jgi:hypothetical protein
MCARLCVFMCARLCVCAARSTRLYRITHCAPAWACPRTPCWQAPTQTHTHTHTHTPTPTHTPGLDGRALSLQTATNGVPRHYRSRPKHRGVSVSLSVSLSLSLSRRARARARACSSAAETPSRGPPATAAAHHTHYSHSPHSHSPTPPRARERYQYFPVSPAGSGGREEVARSGRLADARDSTHRGRRRGSQARQGEGFGVGRCRDQRRRARRRLLLPAQRQAQRCAFSLALSRARPPSLLRRGPRGGHARSRSHARGRAGPRALRHSHACIIQHTPQRGREGRRHTRHTPNATREVHKRSPCLAAAHSRCMSLSASAASAGSAGPLAMPRATSLLVCVTDPFCASLRGAGAFGGCVCAAKRSPDPAVSFAAGAEAWLVAPSRASYVCVCE